MMTRKVSDTQNHTWLNDFTQNQEIINNFRPYVELLRNEIKETKSNNLIVEKQIVSSIISEAEHDLKEAEKRMLVEFNSYSNDNLKYSKLTEREQLVLKHKQTVNRFLDIDELLGLAPSSSYIAFKSAIKKLKNYSKYKLKHKQLNILSNQQVIIYEMLLNKCTDNEIASHMNVNVNLVAVQRKRIEVKLDTKLKPIKEKELSQQQKEIQSLLLQGMKNKEIAVQLGLSATTIKTQKSRIKKLGLI